MLKVGKNKKFKIFLYGNLQNEEEPHILWTSGELRHRTSGDVAAVFGEKYKTRVYGQVKEITNSQLSDLDELEGPQYKRQTITLNNGLKVFAYGYVYKDFEKHELIPSGKYFERLKN